MPAEAIARGLERCAGACRDRGIAMPSEVCVWVILALVSGDIYNHSCLMMGLLWGLFMRLCQTQVDNTVRENKIFCDDILLGVADILPFPCGLHVVWASGAYSQQIGLELEPCNLLRQCRQFGIQWYPLCATKMRCMDCWLRHFDMSLSWWTLMMWFRPSVAFRAVVNTKRHEMSQGSSSRYCVSSTSNPGLGKMPS